MLSPIDKSITKDHVKFAQLQGVLEEATAKAIEQNTKIKQIDKPIKEDSDKNDDLGFMSNPKVAAVMKEALELKKALNNPGFRDDSNVTKEALEMEKDLNSPGFWHDAQLIMSFAPNNYYQS